MAHIEKIERLKKLLHTIAERAPVESLIREPPMEYFGLESFEPLSEVINEEEYEHAHRGIQKIADNKFGELSNGELDALEAIVLPRERPVVFIEQGTYSSIAYPWEHLTSPSIRNPIEAVIPAIGRIELPNNPHLPYGGTGFIVGENLLMTNRHVAELFAQGQGVRNLTFLPGELVSVNFRGSLAATIACIAAWRRTESTTENAEPASGILPWNPLGQPNVVHQTAKR